MTYELTLRESISIVLLSTYLTVAPICLRVAIIYLTSLIETGRFSMVHTSWQRIAAGIMARAAFFAPLTVISPWSGTPPFITYFSKGTNLIYINLSKNAIFFVYYTIYFSVCNSIFNL